MNAPVLLAVDGNSLIHRSYHARAHTGHRLADGRPSWAVQGLLSQLAPAVRRSCAQVVVVGFDDPEASVRRDRWPSYKAQRPTKLATLVTQLEVAREALEELGVAVVVPPGLEADDVLASAAAHARAVGMQAVLCSSDRDCFALLDDTTRLLRVVEGGLGGSPMLDPGRLERLIGVRPDQYADLAALRGDPSDNLPGVRGIGATTAARLLAEFGTARALFEDAAAGGQRIRRVVGAALADRLADPRSRAAWELNREAMTMRSDVPLGLEAAAGRGGLPLGEASVRAVYERFQLGVGTAVASLCATSPGEPRARDQDPNWRPRAARRSAARYAPLRRPRPAHVQDALF